MLKTRILTALILLAGLLPAMFLAPIWVWGLVSLLFLAQGAREWATLLGAPARGLPLALFLLMAGLGWMLYRESDPGAPLPRGALWVCAVTLAVWAVFAPGVLRRVGPVGPTWAMAALSLAACWLSLYELRGVSALTLLSAMAVVWVADIGAYAGGRMLGRHRLAPRVSPGKTWEGALAGALAVLVLAWAVSLYWVPAEPAESAVWSSFVLSQLGLLWGTLALIALVALSIVGDLFESALKRAAGLKDSSQVLPGHGGVLDRIDALIPTMPAALLLVLVLR